MGRDQESKFLVTWGKISLAGCCDLSWLKYTSQWVTRYTASVTVVSSNCETDSLRIEDPNFVAVFNEG